MDPCTLALLGLLAWFLVKRLGAGAGLQPPQDLFEAAEVARKRGQHEAALRLGVAAAVAHLCALMAAADGEVAPDEVQAIRRFFGADGGMPEFDRLLAETLRRAVRNPEPRRATDLLAAAGEEERRLALLAVLSVAAADGVLHPLELVVFRGIAADLGLSPAEVVGIVASVLEVDAEQVWWDLYDRPPPGGTRRTRPASGGMSRADALAILELDEDATEDDIKRAYRRMAKKFHPDRAAHLGPEFVAVAERQMRRINAARDALLG